MARKVLIIDEDKQTRDALELRLENDGFQVVTAEGGIQGFQVAEAENPSVIVLDLEMPDINGLELLDKLRKDMITWDTPVIICTAEDDSESRAQSHRLGISRFLHKPVSPRRILLEINRLMREMST